MTEKDTPTLEDIANLESDDDDTLEITTENEKENSGHHLTIYNEDK